VRGDVFDYNLCHPNRKDAVLHSQLDYNQNNLYNLSVKSFRTFLNPMSSTPLKTFDSLVELTPTAVPEVNGNGNGNGNARPPVTPTITQSRSAEQRSDCLRQNLERHKGERQLVILQDFPDPDALSSAWAYKLIAEQFDIQAEIVYAGALSHQENIALVRLTGLPLVRWGMSSQNGNGNGNGSKAKDLGTYQGCVLIDNQGTTSQILDLVNQAGLPITVVIDHHSLQEGIQAEYADVRPNTRATATMLTQYIQSGLLTLDSGVSDHIKLATALMHGLRSDTNRLMQAQEEDFLAAAFLSRFYDSQLLNTVLLSSRSKQVMDVIERSLKNRCIYNNFSIAGVGYLRYDDRDAIPQAADFLVTEENVHTALVYGIVHDEDDEVELIVGSLRTTKLTLDPDEFIKEAFGQDPQGRFFGGGRSQAGGFEIPMGFLSGLNENTEYAKLKWNVYDTQIKQKLLHLVNPGNNVIHTG
jgi:nanoRNase/pAp phosphatase (c-di-AMP/oligoRNAs hydrolase)